MQVHAVLTPEEIKRIEEILLRSLVLLAKLLAEDYKVWLTQRLQPLEAQRLLELILTTQTDVDLVYSINNRKR